MRVVCPHCLAVNNIPQKDSYKKANCGKCKQSLLDTKPIELKDTSFDEVVVNSDIPVIVDFWAAWCGPCRMVGPVIEEIAKDYEGKAIVGKVDVDANQEFAAKYGVRNIPTVLLFKNGEVIDKQVGVAPKSTYTQKIDAAL